MKARRNAILLAAAVYLSTATAWAELQNVQVGGELRLRGVYLSGSTESGQSDGTASWLAMAGRHRAGAGHGRAFVEQQEP